MSRTLIWFGLLMLSPLAAQETAQPNDVADERSDAYALRGAIVQIDPDRRLSNATLLVRKGRVVSVDEDGNVPPGYVPVDMHGRYIYPGFVDLDSGYGLPEPARPAPFSFSQAEVLQSQTAGAFNVNQAIRSEHAAAKHFSADEEQAKKYRKLGFGAVLTHAADGIARGTGALVSLGTGSDNELVLRTQASAHYSFSKGSSSQSYPISEMGSIALLRQTFLDAQWYGQSNPKPFADQSLDAWLATQGLPQIFAVRSWQSALRADRLGDEFDVQYVIRGTGDEYRRVAALKATGAVLIIPIQFPEAQDVDDPWAAREVPYTDLKHWELAPTNPAALAAADIHFAITSGADEKHFWANLRRALKHGLSERDALAALTTRPAEILGVSALLGSITPGAIANFLVTSKPLFDDESLLEENWIGGRRFVLAEHPKDHSGLYRLQLAEGASYEVMVSGKPGKHKASIPAVSEGDDEIKVTLSFDREMVNLGFAPNKGSGAIRLTGWTEGAHWRGRGQLSDGTWVAWTADRTAPVPGDDRESNENELAADLDLGGLVYPFAPYGWSEPPPAESILFKDATVWTLVDGGVVEDTDVLVRDGRVAAIGRDLAAPNARTIDAAGMHLTPGIVDEHSHIALASINDVATNSGMVRMGDVIDSESVDIYRNLAGGVTAAQLLHGSANPIGGQSALVKFRWGALPNEMLIDGADGFIKFALGENVKRSRNPASIRYPGTRMGVEQVYRDAFTAARDYRDAWADWNAMSRRERARNPAPRRDLALETMVEILAGERFISCHSYRQSEINMLMHVAEDFDFRVNTFTHILEGYKVADKMAAHGAAASTFSDWWAYKWEVRYAIPYGPALMAQAGVTVAVNSDSAEMSRRLNQEAAKSVKYGGMSEVEALKMVTLNPATMLHLDDRMGSIAVGKDADLVLWTDHPLSIYAIPDKTLVDGIVRFDRETDRARRDALASDRTRLIAKMRKAKKPDSSKPASGKPNPEWHCDSLHGYERFTDRLSLR